jgi:hypothetical protein
MVINIWFFKTFPIYLEWTRKPRLNLEGVLQGEKKKLTIVTYLWLWDVFKVVLFSIGINKKNNIIFNPSIYIKLKWLYLFVKHKFPLI